MVYLKIPIGNEAHEDTTFIQILSTMYFQMSATCELPWNYIPKLSSVCFE